MASRKSGSASYLLKFVDVAERQLEAIRGLAEDFRLFHQDVRGAFARADEKFAHTADMFVQLGAWVRENGEGMARANQQLADEIARTNQRLADVAERLFERMAHVDERMALTDERLATTNERLATTNERLVAVEERIERLEQRIELLLRALLRARGDGEGLAETPPS